MWRHFADAIVKCIFWNENVWISIKISLKFVPKRSIINIPALFQIMAWHRPGDKPLSEAKMVSLPTRYASLLLNELTLAFCRRGPTVNCHIDNNIQCDRKMASMLCLGVFINTSRQKWLTICRYYPFLSLGSNIQFETRFQIQISQHCSGN